MLSGGTLWLTAFVLHFLSFEVIKKIKIMLVRIKYYFIFTKLCNYVTIDI